MGQIQCPNSQPEARPQGFLDTSSCTREDVKRRQEEIVRRQEDIMKRLDAIFLEQSQFLQRYEDHDRELDTVDLELERKYQEQEKLRDDLDGIYELSPTDPNENVDPSTTDREDSIRRGIDTIDLQISQLEQKRDEIRIKTDALTVERDRLEQEEADLEEEDDDLNREWEVLMEYEPMDDDQDSEPSTDEEDLTRELNDDILSALGQRTSALCSICRNFPRGRLEFIETKFSIDASHMYHPSLYSLKRSVDGGCYLCEDVAQSVEQFCQESNPSESQKEFWSIRCRITEGRWRSLQIWFLLCQCELGHPDDTGCEHARQLGGRQFLPARQLILGPEFSDPTIMTSSAKSAASFDIARSWYQKCLKHETCRSWRRETRFLPTRLIQIRGPDTKASKVSARLCETNGLPTTTPYVSLSHCWGKCVLFTLTQNNLDDLRREIPISQLPKTFQDAIDVTFKLGINYLWIDSLCIIQDSKEDWTHEAKRMGDVYLHGEFNISATAYEDGSEGLFGERTALPLVHFPLYMEFTLVEKYVRKKTSFKGFYICWNDSEFHDKIHMGLIFSRAWVAQERALSPAIIHYTREKIWWECNQEIFNEAVPDSPYLNGNLIWEQVEGGGRDRVRSLSKQSQPEQVYSFWKTFLTNHGGAFLTYYKDRFPAMAGLARIVGDYIDDDLVAGFWSGDLIRSLIMARGSTRIAIQPELIAPTWSWASLCSTPYLVSQDEAKVTPLEGVQIIKVLSDVPGFKSDLQSTHFETSAVRGLVIRGVLRRLPDNFKSRLNDNSLGKVWVGPEWISDVEMMSDHRTACLLGKESIPEQQKWRLEDPTHMLLLAKEYSDRLSCELVYGILVQSADMDDPNTFRRTGTIEFTSRDGTPKWDEYFGLGKDSENQDSSWFQERGLQDIVLI
ncbi:hypothetical protein KVR01_003334 [Diaporthe batatas]|uniref:uncharacterized protein n=1 Tax=Diaporthe batatas TaxID=748121 RepID=UPI001D044D33|nr:uncharacterized protein KVR01_003334 [Diaporthe batatas]KAG8167645.1 hypothetical protein KVR01_003334 [Diaporthe batatas]